jgi:AcrR family transcriptional regulator
VPRATAPYHHGNLPAALRSTAAAVIAERGLADFSLREVARRAGVSHNAPAHHFGDVRGLLTSLAVEGFKKLYETTAAAAAAHDDPIERLSAIGIAYVELAKSHPGYCAVMFRIDVIDCDDAAMLQHAEQAYGVLERSVTALIESEGVNAPVDDVAWLCWSAMQGLVTLEPNLTKLSSSRGGGDISVDDIVRRFTNVIVNGVRGLRH